MATTTTTHAAATGSSLGCCRICLVVVVATLFCLATGTLSFQSIIVSAFFVPPTATISRQHWPSPRAAGGGGAAAAPRRYSMSQSFINQAMAAPAATTTSFVSSTAQGHSSLLAKGSSMQLQEQQQQKQHLVASTVLGVSLFWLSVVLPVHASAAALETTFAISSTTSMTTTRVWDPKIFTNDYADPFHPLCQRHIQVSADGTTFAYTGTAVGPKNDPVRRGCSSAEIKEYGLRRGAFEGILLPPGNRISAGDGIHEGVWEPAATAAVKQSGLDYQDVDGIRWNDGNKWIVKSQSQTKKQPDGSYLVQKKSTVTTIGEGIFYSYIGFSTLAGAKGLYDGIQRRKKQQELS